MKFLKPKVVLDRYGYSRSQWYAAQQDGTYVRSVKIGKRAAVIPEVEAEAIAAALVAGATVEQVKRLVARLHEQRTAGMPALS